MKKIIPLVLVIMVMWVSLQSTKANAQQQNVKSNHSWVAFYKHVVSSITYAQKAKDANLQGNSLVLFTIAEGGQLKNIKVETELGLGLDVSIVNGILSYPNLKSLKVGKYALTTLFLIDEHKGEIRNKDLKIPQGYTTLEKLVVTGGYNIVCEKGQVIAATPKINNFSADVLVVVDGKILNAAESNNIEAKNIKSFTVLKGLSAIADYGDQGRNGVIVISTKDQEIASRLDKTNLTVKLKGADNEPIYIVDDKLVDDIRTITPDNIEHITILRNASAYALYGDKAKNGAIIISTKNTDSTPQKNTLAIKWNGSADKANSPIYIVDDKLVDDISTITPDNIEHITILKNASAYALYGEYAKNGVILITTKKETKQVSKP